MQQAATPALPSAQPPRFSALRYRNFTALWAGLIVSNTGTWMQNVAMGWLVLQLTNSPLWLGFLGLSFALPMTLLPLFSGTIVDRVHRIRLVYLTQTSAMLVAFALALLTWLGLINVWFILAGSFLGATLLAFDNPARQALVPDLVPRKDLLNALSLSSATFNGAALVGPALAGVLLARYGAALLFSLNGVSFLAVIFALATIRNVRTHSGGQHGSVFESVKAGFSFAWHKRLVFTLLALSALAALFGRSYQNLLPIFARDIWHDGPEGYGLLLAASGAGALAGAFSLAALRQVRNKTLVLLGSGFVFTLSIIAFALSPSFWIGFALMFVAGVALTVFGTIVATYIQLETPNELRGRIMSLWTITLIGLPSLGALGVGAAAELLGGLQGAPRAVLLGALILGVILLAVTPSMLRVHVAEREQGQPAPPI